MRTTFPATNENQIDFAVSEATLHFFGATMLEDEFMADARVILGRGLAPAAVTWSGPYTESKSYTAHVVVGHG